MKIAVGKIYIVFYTDVIYACLAYAQTSPQLQKLTSSEILVDFSCRTYVAFKCRNISS